MKLPAAGDPAKARWRAAHFLYYQPPESAGQDVITSSSNSQQPKYVVYEGDMVDSQREGRGICLYNNGLLYEGEWMGDKEHGTGTLVTSDRKRVIYRGDFEKGRIHGRGVYNYYSSPHHTSAALAHKNNKAVGGKKANTATFSLPPLEKESRYEGEFRESLRHGTGTYYLPDGSVYNGNFKDNDFSGWGMFTWPDGSVYNGDWKDGKRHGPGVLRASDGFIYEGTWVTNTMEGRGTAKYPLGQEYNGMFSQGRREGRGAISFSNGAEYEGRFRDDAIDGQGTMKMGRIMVVPRDDGDTGQPTASDDDDKEDFMIPVSFQNDMGHIHRKAGFTHSGK
jgi:hypothetical protein